jgi:hypothetical protein
MSESEFTNTTGAIETIIWTGLLLLTLIQSSCLFQITSRTHSSTARLVQILIFVAFSVAILWWSLVNISEVGGDSTANQQKVEALSIIDLCSDPYTRVAIDDY